MDLSKYKNTLTSFFFTRRHEDANFFAFFRITIGLFLLIHFIAVLRDFDLIYANRLIPMELGKLFGALGLPSLLDLIHLLSSYFNMSNQTSFLLVKVVYITLCCSLITGFLSRFSAIGLLVMGLMLSQGAHLFMYGVDRFKAISLFYCCVFPLGSNFSMDRKIFRYDDCNPSPYRKIIQIHLCFVYFFSGVDKAMGINWWNGVSIWKAIHLPSFVSDFNFNYAFMADFPFMTIAIGWATVITEMLYPFFIWPKKTRNFWLTMTVLMHVGIIIFLNLSFFGTLMILLNLLAFLNLGRKNEQSDIL